MRFARVSGEGVWRSGERDGEGLRDRAAHAVPIDEQTLVYRIELDTLSQGY
jgi:hypothetical protein